ncbi:uncharacterized protein LOC131011750 [Salvia miltiorrhiza]|uniref:uncharacterized protein LOC131011750 n=1 Tax=Salvia miltiorrhiza TaxID=226208 RepID=UPI0025ABEE0F|nr:uncharacterized protein LOC131011750 [Salvia miltiorrhiza]
MFNQGQQNPNSGWRTQQNSGWRNQAPGQGSGPNQGNQFRRPPQQFGYQNQQQFYPPQQQFPFPQQQNYPQAYQQQPPQYQQYQQLPMQQGNFQQQQQQFQTAPQQFQKQAQPQKPTLEDTMQSFMEMTKQSMESQSATIKRLETTVGQLSGTLNQMQQQQQPGKLHGQGLQPHQAQAVTVLRSGKVVNNKVEAPVEEPPKEARMEKQVKEPLQPREEDKEKEKEPEVKLHKAVKPYKPPVPYPSRLKNEKLDQQFTDFYNMLAKVNVNLPLLDVIRNVPAYLKFFKELASKKRRFEDNEKILVSEVANSIMQQPLPTKQRDPADRSVRYPHGVVEDILVRVGGLIVPVDFVVLEIGEVHENGKEHTLLLGRPFMATTNTLIDVKNGTIKMTVLGESVSFSVHHNRAMPSSSLTNECSYIDAIDGLAEMFFVQEQEVVEVFAGSADMEEFAREDEERERARRAKLPIDEAVVMDYATKMKSTLELKELPKNLKYVYLEGEAEKPVIISAELTHEQELALMEVLRKNKAAFGWGLADIKGISPATCMHRIHLEEGARPKRDGQRRLNPVLMEVVRKEILKLLAEGITVILNDDQELGITK